MIAQETPLIRVGLFTKRSITPAAGPSCGPASRKIAAIVPPVGDKLGGRSHPSAITPRKPELYRHACTVEIGSSLTTTAVKANPAARRRKGGQVGWPRKDSAGPYVSGSPFA